ncbi:MAG: ATP-binding protein [Planctomycetaceae bacterium]
MSPGEIENAVKSLTSYDWSAEPTNADVNTDINHDAQSEALNDFCERRDISHSLTSGDFLEAIGATKNGQLTKGGLLFLGTESAIRDKLGDYEYRFSWKTLSGQLVINDVWAGCLWDTIKRAKGHFADCNSEKAYSYEDREFKVPLLDPIAFHEAYLNALVHRDYSSEGMVSVTFAGKRITITSPGIFFGGVTADNIAMHEPRHRNKSLARMLMTYHLVDRAGMGVLRMGLRSLMYGRAFPEFREDSESVEVVMEGEYLRPAVAVLAIDNEEHYGIPELLILNSVFEDGVVSVNELIRRLTRLVDDPWDHVQNAVDAIQGVELCGTRDGIFVRVRSGWLKFFKCPTLFRVSSTSKKHVDLFTFLKKHGSVSSADIHPILGSAHQSYTSRFLAEAKYTKRIGNGPSSRWSLT